MAHDSSTEPADDDPSLDLTLGLLTGRQCSRSASAPLTVMHTSSVSLNSLQRRAGEQRWVDDCVLVL